ncbi:MAG: hypothetical protein IBX55_01390 [Methyloprofundus sp.]|nr:hypothetical protein [Methyloprofundus sp.]
MSLKRSKLIKLSIAVLAGLTLTACSDHLPTEKEYAGFMSEQVLRAARDIEAELGKESAQEIYSLNVISCKPIEERMTGENKLTAKLECQYTESENGEVQTDKGLVILTKENRVWTLE